jgi:hypothetical protein
MIGFYFFLIYYILRKVFVLFLGVLFCWGGGAAGQGGVLFEPLLPKGFEHNLFLNGSFFVSPFSSRYPLSSLF